MKGDSLMKKLVKFLVAIAGIAAAVCTGLYVYKKFFEIEDDFDDEEFDDFDDCDDEDFEPVKREYVPITLDKEEVAEEAEETEEVEEAAEAEATEAE